MATIPDSCEFKVKADQLRFTTQTNGDHVLIKGIQLGKNAAAALAYLINDTTNHLKIEIKKDT